MNKKNMEDVEKFAKCITIISVSYNKVFSEEHFDVWFDLLMPYPVDRIEAAIKRHVTSPDQGQFPPKPADIIRMLEGSSSSAAAVAWTKLEQAIGSPGVYCDVCFDDAIINKVVFDLGGWVKTGNTAAREWPFVEKDFKERYAAYKSRGVLTEYPRQLTGIANAANSLGGFALEPVRLVGNQAAAKAVHEGGSEKISAFLSSDYVKNQINSQKTLKDQSGNAD